MKHDHVDRKPRARNSSLARTVGAYVVAAAGTIAVFLSVTFMNRFVVLKEKTPTNAPVTFEVKQPRQKLQTRSLFERTRRSDRRSARNASLAPIPDFQGSISGIAVDLPDFAMNGLAVGADSLLNDIGDVAMTEDTVDEKPTPRNASITYPERAKQMKIEGQVVVSALIGTDGRVRKLKILESVPPGVFDEPVREMVPRWSFEPAKYQGQNVEIWVTIPIRFSLK